MSEEGSMEWLRERNGYLTEVPNPDATKPTGMCGSSVKCVDCPSDFLCAMKASREQGFIERRGTS